jgi:quinol monooxygenase YgiN
MAQLSVHHQVADYTKWRKIYDEMDAIRRSKFGMTSARVFRTAANPNEIVVETEWPTLEHAQAYAASPDLKTGMEKAGVTSQPNVLFLAEL